MLSRMLAKMPEDAPAWLEPFHLDFYGGFIRNWEKHVTEEVG
jgi:hypothetical protein